MVGWRVGQGLRKAELRLVGGWWDALYKVPAFVWVIFDWMDWKEGGGGGGEWDISGWVMTGKKADLQLKEAGRIGCLNKTLYKFLFTVYEILIVLQFTGGMKESVLPSLCISYIWDWSRTVHLSVYLSLCLSLYR